MGHGNCGSGLGSVLMGMDQCGVSMGCRAGGWVPIMPCGLMLL